MDSPFDSITRWIDSVNSSDDPLPREKRARDDDDDCNSNGDRSHLDDDENRRPRVKRARTANTLDALEPDLRLRTTPPPTEPTMSKRSLDPSIRLGRTSSTSSSQAKRSRGSPTKSRSILQLLEQPPSFQALDQGMVDLLPSDIRQLYCEINTASLWKQHIIPIETRERVEERFGKFPDTVFRVSPSEDALPMLDSLYKILSNAVEATKFNVHEDYWNNMVHTPLLNQVFDREGTPERGAAVRVLPATCVSIAPDSSPWCQSKGTQTPTDQSNDAVTVAASSGAHQTEQTEQTEPTQTNRGQDSKKVDYLLVLDLDEGTELHKVIASLVNNLALKENRAVPPHVNQTTYPIAAYRPIAVSIETKRGLASTDPLTQLVIWTAAWHKRMRYLRWELTLSKLATWPRDQQPGTGAEGEGTTTRLVSVPLIQVVGHQWQIYFACEKGANINIYGLVSLGSTQDIASLYSLVTSLEALQRWIQTNFYHGIQEWFMCKEATHITGRLTT
ncbi:hypothetical protein F5X98DRAFT_358294 [Xylaria grammica]|nr:hypothetical protein F5X98DRAFT_358294 [Xylaria grammica]